MVGDGNQAARAAIEQTARPGFFGGLFGRLFR